MKGQSESHKMSIEVTEYHSKFFRVMKSQNQSHKMSVKVTEYHSNFLETIFYDLLELIIFYQMQLSCDSPVTPL